MTAGAAVRWPASVAATSSTTPRCIGSDMWPTPRTRTFRAPRSGCSQRPDDGRQDDLVEVAVDGGDLGAAVRHRLGELLQDRGAGTQLADHRRRYDVREHRALVRRAERHQRLHPPVTALALQVVPGDQSAEAVPDDVHPLVPGLLAHPLDVGAQVGRAAGDVRRQRAVVPGTDLREPASAQAAAHHGEDRAVVDEAVHEDDGDARRERVCGEQSAGAGRLAAGPVAPVRAQFLGPRAQRIHEHVGADPGQFGESAGQRCGAAERAQTTTWRSLGSRWSCATLDLSPRRRSTHRRYLPVSLSAPAPGSASHTNGAPLCSVHAKLMPLCGSRHTSPDPSSADRRRFVTRLLREEPCPPATPEPGPPATAPPGRDDVRPRPPVPSGDSPATSGPPHAARREARAVARLRPSRFPGKAWSWARCRPSPA